MEEKTRSFIERELCWGAHNYAPLPVVLERGSGAVVHDVEGRRYLDMLSAYSALNQGHNHPRIVAAAKAQLDRLCLTSRAFHNDRLGPLLERLCRMTRMETAILMNSGAEAVETAIKAVRLWGYAKKRIPQDEAVILAAEGNFHGRTTTIVGFSSEPKSRKNFGPPTPGFRLVPYGDARALEAAITGSTCAFLVEPIQGEAGVRIPPERYLRQVRDICSRRDVLLCLDEIQTGLGRTGKMFCADHEGVQPDVFILGKALSGGLYPVSAFVADEELMGVFNPGDHGSTFGGNPLGAAIGRAALKVLKDEKLAERATELGDWFMCELQKCGSPHVEEVRGRGFLIGVEIKKESGPARPYCEALAERGILAKETHDQVVRFAPPLVTSKQDLQWALTRIAEVLK
ncbi:MAG: ornithine--oxo-acid transaminase, partial [Elusimicrobia bacterium]|nr:ornithine--oxo-acid transaminase [Elusimicrobiota bacterium]